MTDRMSAAAFNELIAKSGAAGGRVARGRAKAGTMNKTEARYELLLQQSLAAGEIVWFRFEAMTFKLADDTRYTPDFMVMLASGELECREIKGHWEEDARVKIKVAASMFPMRFVAVMAQPAKGGGGFVVTEVFE